MDLHPGTSGELLVASVFLSIEQPGGYFFCDSAVLQLALGRQVQQTVAVIWQQWARYWQSTWRTKRFNLKLCKRLINIPLVICHVFWSFADSLGDVIFCRKSSLSPIKVCFLVELRLSHPEPALEFI